MQSTLNTKSDLLRLLALVVFFSPGCGEKPTDTVPLPGNESSGRIEITNDEGMLTGRIRHINEVVAIDPVSNLPGPQQVDGRTAFSDFTLELISEISPPSIDGQLLQATAVAFQGELAFVSYGAGGSRHLGAIDVIEIRSGAGAVVRSSARFHDTEINAISVDDSFVYAAVTTEEERFEFPAGLERIGHFAGKLTLQGNWRFPLNSDAGTSAYAAGGKIYATSGDDGGLHVFDSGSLKKSRSLPLHDARWVDGNNGRVLVVQGTPGRLSVIDVESLSPIAIFSFEGADIPGTKSTVESVGSTAFVAAGVAGVQILNIDSGAWLGAIPRPDPKQLGLDTSVVTTNAVTVDDNLVFIANGEAGVYVVEGEVDFGFTDGVEPPRLSRPGRLRLDQLQSVGHVAYEDKRLLIASGSGGVKILRVHD